MYINMRRILYLKITNIKTKVECVILKPRQENLTWLMFIKVNTKDIKGKILNKITKKKLI